MKRERETHTHVRDVRRAIRHATSFDLVPPVQDPLIIFVPVPPVQAIDEPVNFDVPPPLVEAPLVVHVEHGLQEQRAQVPEVRVLEQIALSQAAAAIVIRPCGGWRRREDRRAVGMT